MQRGGPAIDVAELEADRFAQSHPRGVEDQEEGHIGMGPHPAGQTGGRLHKGADLPIGVDVRAKASGHPRSAQYVRDICGRIRASAEQAELARDAKVQVEFNADTIKTYRLIGYEKRKIKDTDFRNDAERWVLPAPETKYEDAVGHLREYVNGLHAEPETSRELNQRAVEGWKEFAGHSPHRPWIDLVKIKNPKTGNVMSRIPDVGNPWLDESGC